MALRSSPAGEFQAAITRAKIGATLWSRTFFAIILTWIALTIWLIWYRVAVPHHVYFGRWILCGIINDTPLLDRFAPRLPMYAGGSWYALPSFVQWLDQPAIYGGSFYSWYWRATTGLGGYYGFGTYFLPLSLIGLVVAWRVRRDPDSVEHLRGLQLLTPRRLNRELHGSRLLTPQPEGMRIGQVVVPSAYECEHFVFLGNPGSGKTTCMFCMLDQLQKRGLTSAVIVDPERQFTEAFYNESRGDIILNPLDARCPYWSWRSEIRDDWFAVDAAALAASLIRGLPRADNERFFLTSTRTVIEAIFQLARDTGDVKELLDFVALERGALHKALKGTPAYQLIDPQAHDQGAGILGTASNAIKTFVHLPSRQEAARIWSAREWAHHRQGWIFLPSRPDFHSAIELLQGLWLDCLVRWLMSPETSANAPRTWLFCDELASLGYQPNVETLVTRGRKWELPTVLAFQNISQLKRHYGEESATTLISSTITRLFLRIDEPKTTNWISGMIGHHEIERVSITQLAGLSTYREGMNISSHRSVEALVLPDEISLLKKFEGYLCIAGHNRSKVTIPKQFPVPTQPGFIQRAHVHNVEQIKALTDDHILQEMKTHPARSTSAQQPEPELPDTDAVIAQMTERAGYGVDNG